MPATGFLLDPFTRREGVFAVSNYKSPRYPCKALRKSVKKTGATCKWLDDYIQFSRYWSPEAFDGYHEACGLFILSTIAARRVGVVFGGIQYPSLYLALVGRSTLPAKSTTAKNAIDLLRKAGFAWMLAPDSSTPERFVSDLGSYALPGNFEELPSSESQIALMSALYASQKGWYYDEFGMHLSDMMKRNGIMNRYRGLFRVFHDNHDTYQQATISRGKDHVDRPYLSLLATMTPADLQPYAGKSAALWGDGYLARFALISPPKNFMRTKTFPPGKREIPDSLVDPLIEWHQQLGIPTYKFVETDEEKKVKILDWPHTEVRIPDEVREDIEEYRTRLRDMIFESDVTDLDGNYGRFPEKAIRIATLFASLDGSHEILWKHWARAKETAEQWRKNLHDLYDQLNHAEDSTMLTNEEKVIRQIKKRGPITCRTIQQNTGLLAADVNKELTKLARRRLIINKQKKPFTYEFHDGNQNN